MTEAEVEKSGGHRRLKHLVGRPLSSRELEVLYLTAEGKTNIEIAEVLCVSVHSVKTFASRAYAKLQANNAAHAVAKLLSDPGIARRVVVHPAIEEQRRYVLRMMQRLESTIEEQCGKDHQYTAYISTPKGTTRYCPRCKYNRFGVKVNV